MFSYSRSGIALNFSDTSNAHRASHRPHNVEPGKGIGRKASDIKLDWSAIVRAGALRPIVSPRRL